MDNLGSVTPILFTLTTLWAIWLFKKAFNPTKLVWLVVLVWLLLQAYLAEIGFYQTQMSFPPKFMLVVIPPLLFIFFILFTKPMRFFDEMDLARLHWIHIVRIPVEVVLFLLFRERLIPEVMTFEGRNFDILMGITAPIVIFFLIKMKSFNSVFLLVWNVMGLLFLLNIVFLAIFSVQTPFQKFGFDVPNKAVLTYPYIWLPAFIVPMVLFSHLVVIFKKIKRQN